MTVIILAAAVILLICLVYAEKRASFGARLVFKPALSALFIAVAGIQPWPLRGYMIWVMAGLALSWFGDLFLIFKSRAMFLSGLVAFLLGHVCYGSGFFLHGGRHWGVLAGLAALLGVSLFIFLWLRPHLGDMQGPVIAYILIISAMVDGALAFCFAPDVNITAKWLVLPGALLFYASDICVARDQFVKPGFDNRLIGLPLYYAAQFMFALSVGAI